MKNSDLTQQAFCFARSQRWTPSPSGSVDRKRYFHRGGAEDGEVSSLVRYARSAHFPAHHHPRGEEILVLHGVFSDACGDYPAPCYILNPEGFEHEPHSVEGCLLFVRLRQYHGRDRVVRRVTVGAGGTQELHREGDRLTSIVDLPEGDKITIGGEKLTECLVMSGQLTATPASFERHDWFRLPAGGTLDVTSAGCQLYLQEYVR